MEARPARGDELHHLALAGGSARWFETFAFDFAAADASIAGYLIVTLRPSEGRAWCWACVAGIDRPIVALLEDDAPLPRRTPLELRASGLWLDVQCETPFEHMSVGLECFGLTLDDPTDAIGDRRGVLTPVGFDLEWETDGERRGDPGSHYELPCRVTGELLVGDEQFALDVRGARSHCWGPDPWWLRAAPEVLAPGGVEVLVAVPTEPAAVLRSVLGADGEGQRWRHALRPPGRAAR